MTKTVWVTMVGIATFAIAACGGGDTVSGPKKDVSDIFWALKLNHMAVTMATGETLQLSATPLSVDGTPLTGLPAAQYTSGDTSVVVIDAQGRMIAKNPGYMVNVVATLTSPEDGVTNADTLYVTVNSTAQPLRSFQIQQPDSMNLAAGWFTDVIVQATDLDGNPVFGLSIYYSSSNNTRASVDPFFAFIEPKNVGPVTLYAEATIHGTVFKDSVTYNITYPLESSVSIANTDELIPTSPAFFQMPVTHIQRGGTVRWENGSTHPVDVTFDNPGAVDGGNVESIPSNDGQSRVFPTAGTYTYRSTRWNSAGRVIVH